MTRHSFAASKAVASALFSLLMLFAIDAGAASYAALVIEPDSNRVLFERHAHSRRHPASLTKMMTLYMVFEALDNRKLSLRKSLKVSRYAASRPASKLGLRTRDTITVEQAILALVTHSANDVATVIAEHL
ncbi:MAG: serine hydrolase, partial [Pseudomonadota bacterium]